MSSLEAVSRFVSAGLYQHVRMVAADLGGAHAAGGLLAFHLLPRVLSQRLCRRRLLILQVPPQLQIGIGDRLVGL